VSEPAFPDGRYPDSGGAAESGSAARDQDESTGPEAPEPSARPATEPDLTASTAVLPATEPDLPPATGPTEPEPTAVYTPEADPDPEPATPSGSAPRRARLAFRRWRRSRPFWGGLLVTLGGAEITFTEKAAFKVVVHVGLYGLAGYLLPMILILCGLLTIFNPQQRTFYSILSVLLSLGTWLTSNLGGFFLGMLLGIIGGSLAFGWAPGERAPRRSEHRRGSVRRRQMHSDPAP
jgi:Family of unknown function (DUF6114)